MSERPGASAPIGAVAPAAASLVEWSEDLRALAWLHVAERDAAALTGLRDGGFPTDLALAGVDPAAIRAFDEALAAIGRGEVSGDELAADFAAIYLTHALRVSPCESVWRDEDGLMLQAPTFAVRAAMRRHALRVADWRQMPDDHIAIEIDFLATLVQRGEADEAASFLDQHLLRWAPDFCAAVGHRAGTALYRALAGLTAAYCVTLRGALGVPPESAQTDGPKRV